jgi:hypothetical protein
MVARCGFFIPVFMAATIDCPSSFSHDTGPTEPVSKIVEATFGDVWEIIQFE